MVRMRILILGSYCVRVLTLQAHAIGDLSHAQTTLITCVHTKHPHLASSYPQAVAQICSKPSVSEAPAVDAVAVQLASEMLPTPTPPVVLLGTRTRPSPIGVAEPAALGVPATDAPPIVLRGVGTVLAYADTEWRGVPRPRPRPALGEGLGVCAV